MSVDDEATVPPAGVEKSWNVVTTEVLAAGKVGSFESSTAYSNRRLGTVPLTEATWNEIGPPITALSNGLRRSGRISGVAIPEAGTRAVTK